MWTEQHPLRHRNHHHILGQRHEIEWDIAVAANAGAFELTLVDVDRFENRRCADCADEQGYRYRRPVEGARDHQNARQPLGKGIDSPVRNPSLREQDVVQKHRRKLVDIPEPEHDKETHTESDEDLRRRLSAMFGFERVGFFAR